MFIRSAIAVAVAAPILFAAPAAHAAPVDDLLAALGIPRVIEIMREEGLNYAETMGADMGFAGSGSDWASVAGRIYDTDRMEESMRAGFAESLGDRDLGPLVSFFNEAPGDRIVELEIEAREAMVAPEAEEAAREAYRARAEEGGDRLEQIDRFVAAGDLVEQNVTGALNASLAFYEGLVDGGALEMSEDEILRDVWAQEGETRADTEEWLYAYLLLAYEPLSGDTLETYVDFGESEDGRALNRALFAGFNDMYNDLSYAMGLAAARQMAGTEL
ncbi:hypothetical protein ROJ8625_01863 [Roseivivax jejudonensis]|uniref:Uncharacterized protein n=1 Tax=Roseivivax jejudonensis TaxID=1529041 RepID=A0A1X6Z3V6_9RHOB|nr:DUF2059 domain-containing protein [Roseivivax jejudonensis]SLN39727.1 hypothetical protein ROJ8625_01863 [Roseivivax jejudonensis]